MCALLFGMEKSRREREKLKIAEGLLAFVVYVGRQIESFKTPLGRIYSDFYDEGLDALGFCSILQSEGLTDALKKIEDKIPEALAKEMYSFSKGIGAGYEKGQAELCSYTAKVIESSVKSIKEELGDKVRMYRLLPLLLVLSLVILFL